MKKVVESIKSFGDLSGLSSMGTMARSLFEVLNPSRHKYTIGETFEYEDESHKSEVDILDSLKTNRLLKFNMQDRKSNAFVFCGSIVSATRVPEDPMVWVLGISGNLTRNGYKHAETCAKMVCLYNTETGQGEVMIPELARYELRSAGC